MGTALYVATNLDHWTAGEDPSNAGQAPDAADPSPGDQVLGGLTYRALDPVYYAWLHGRMKLARLRLDEGRLPRAAFEVLSERFEQVKGWAIERFGRAALVQAVREGVPRGFIPPAHEMPMVSAASTARSGTERQGEPLPAPSSPSPAPPFPLFPETGDLPFDVPVSPAALAQVDAIRESALSLGWTHAGLYQNRGTLRFPMGGNYGLAPFLEPGDSLGQVTTRSIAIHRLGGAVLHFYNPAVAQPWDGRPSPSTGCLGDCP